MNAKCPSCGERMGGIAVQGHIQKFIWGNLVIVIMACPVCETMLNVQAYIDQRYDIGKDNYDTGKIGNIGRRE